MAAHARTFNRDKALEAILYIAQELRSASFHSISKILYLADKCHLQHYGRLVCGDRYIAMEYGPVPSATYNMMKVADGRETIDPDTDAIIKEAFVIQSGRYIKPRRKANKALLSQSEIDCMSQTIKKYGRKSFGQLTDIAHDKAWESADENKPISLEAMARTLPNAAELLAHLRA